MNTSPSWISPLARVGYAAKGIVYFIIGYLALKFAIDGGGEITGSSGALAAIRSQPFGQGLLIIMGIGLAAYAVFRLLGAFLDVEGEGEDGEGLAKRSGYLGSGVSYAALAIASFTGVSGGGNGEQQATGKLLSMPGGAWIVGALGVAIILAGVFQWVKALKKKYKGKFMLDDYAATKRQWINGIAKTGLIARGIIFPIIGFFLIKAGMESDASEAKGLGGALKTLAGEAYGPWLLGFTAAGLVCYGVYCFVLARYGRFGSKVS